MKSTSLSSIFSELSKLDEDTYPPVEIWNPPLCENVHMKITCLIGPETDE